MAIAFSKRVLCIVCLLVAILAVSTSPATAQVPGQISDQGLAKKIVTRISQLTRGFRTVDFAFVPHITGATATFLSSKGRWPWVKPARTRHGLASTGRLAGGGRIRSCRIEMFRGFSVKGMTCFSELLALAGRG